MKMWRSFVVVFILFAQQGTSYVKPFGARIVPNKVFMAKKGGGSSSSGAGSGATSFVSIEDVHSDLWQLESVIDVLRAGGVGVIPTDTCYSFVAPLSSRSGLERLMRLKGISGQKKPLSLLCKDVSTISKYTSALTDQKWVFKLLKTCLPGPFTFIFRSSKEVPKLIIENEKHIKKWKRKEIGVRLPDDGVCRYILDALDEPLLCGSVPEALEDEVGILSLSAQRLLVSASGKSHADDDDEETVETATMTDDSDDDDDTDTESEFDANFINQLGSCAWYPHVDFVVAAGPRGVVVNEVADTPLMHLNKKAKKNNRVTMMSAALSTVVDLTRDPPVLLRQGKGTIDIEKMVIPP